MHLKCKCMSVCGCVSGEKGACLSACGTCWLLLTTHRALTVVQEKVLKDTTAPGVHALMVFAVDDVPPECLAKRPEGGRKVACFGLWNV